MSLLILFVIIPLGTAFLIPVLSRFWKGLPDWLGNGVTLFLMGLSLWMIRFSGETLVYHTGGWEPVSGIPIGITMVLDGLSLLVLLIVNVIAFFVTVYSINYMSHYTDKGKYYTLFLLMIAGLNGVVLSGDIFNLFVFLEITAIASYALVAFGVEAEELEASFKYQILGGTASAFILLGIAFFYHLTGTLNLADASQILSTQAGNPALIFTAVLFLVGFSLKAALMPFHAWLPDAHPSAPAPISAMLSGVVIKVLGLYALIRIFFNVFGIQNLAAVQTILMIMGVLSMVAGAYLALGQKDFKRLLAYSSISQIGYVLFALAIGTPLAILGGLFHLLNHASIKSLLFLNAGAIVYRTESRDLEKMGGLSQKMPVTGTTSLIGSLSMSGLPPFGGFWSKLIIIMAAIQSNKIILACVAILISIVTLTYYMKYQKKAFLGTLQSAFKNIKEVPPGMCFSMIMLAIISISLGVLLLPALRSVILDPAVNVISDGLSYAQTVLGG